MKIISKYKDYYDYLQGEFGIDDVLTYDRRSDNIIRPLQDPPDDPFARCYSFAICNQGYAVFSYNNKFYHTIDELVKLDVILKKAGKRTIFTLGYGYHKNQRKAIWDTFNPKTDINKKLRKPVLVSSENSPFAKDEGWEIPLLREFGFARIIDPKTLFIEISNFMGWLNDNPEIPNKQTNKEKIVSHGFDLKKSFRHRKKE